jgi:hypothetical protein
MKRLATEIHGVASLFSQNDLTIEKKKCTIKELYKITSSAVAACSIFMQWLRHS